MPTVRFQQDFSKGVNIDLDESRLPPDAAQFMKNLTANVNQNPNSSAGVGANAESWTPMEGNVELAISLPDGQNTCIGFYSSEQTNEGYLFIHNSFDQHSIWVIYGDTGLVDRVWEGPELPFTLRPEDFIAEGRCTLTLKAYIDPVTLQETNFKFLTFLNGLVQQYMISVTDAILTGSYNTIYFSGAGTFYERNTLINLGVPTPISCIGVEEVPVVEEDADKQNLIARNAFQFRVKFVDVFGRESIHGIISNAWVSVVGGGCISSGAGFPRCLELNFDAGNPLVDYIQIEYRKWVGNDRAGALQTGWIKYDTISKWIHAPGEQWYERSPNTVYYDTATNKITYTFCADKNCQPIPDVETTLTEPGIPRTSNSVMSPNKRIGLVNNVRGFQPIDPAEIDKISIFPEIPEEAPCAAPPLRTIIVYASIYNPYNETTSYIRKTEEGVYYFGQEDGACDDLNGNAFRMDQVFGDQDNPGFPFYMAGTQYCGVALWGGLDATTGIFTVQPTYPEASSDLWDGLEPICQIKLTVPAGKYVLRGASHKAALVDSDYQATSTYLAGIAELADAVAGAARKAYAENPLKELVIDCSAGDVIYDGSTDPLFVILDLGRDVSSAIDGYLYEQQGQNVPIEMAPINFRTIGGGDTYGSFFTDHNGYFFGVGGGVSNPFRIVVYLDTCAGLGPEFQLQIINAGSYMKHGDGTGAAAGPCATGGFWKNRVFIDTVDTFPSAGRRTIEQSVFLCDTTTGLPNILMVMTKGAVAITDIAGLATIIAHNRYDYAAITWVTPDIGTIPAPVLSGDVPDYSAAPESDDVLVFSSRGGCRWTSCGTCDSFIANPEIEYIGCDPDRETTLDDVFLALTPVGVKGVQTGGRYGVGVWLFDDIGRHTFFQVRQGEDGFITMPNQNDTLNPPYPAQMLSSIGYSINPTFQVPTIFKKMVFGVTENTIFSDFLSWDADYVQFVDNTGQTNTVNPTSVRIYYGSLNEYKKINNNTVNCGWQFATDAGASVVGDIVQFIMNGDGTFFPMGLSAQVSYNSSGLFFTFPFQEEFRSFTNGLLFRVIRPKSCQTNYVYYEQCMVVNLVDGQVPSGMLEGVLPYFDSYMLGRLIPVPILQGQPGPIPPGGMPPNPIEYTSTDLDATLAASGYATNNTANNNQVLVMSVNDSLTSFPFYFESPSPSDFWGSHLSNRGRIGVVNPYEGQRRIGTEVALSATTDDRSNLNGMSWFNDISNVYEFDRNTWGNITIALMEVGRIIFICESDHFYSNFNQTQLNAAADGSVSAFNQYGPFTSPQRPFGTPYGCTPFNINTIRKYQGKVIWLDAEGRLIQSNFSAARDISTTDLQNGVIGGYSGYLMNKLAYVNVRNNTEGNLVYFVGGIDPRTQEYYLTSFQLTSDRPGFERYYLNNEPYIALSSNETICVDLDSGMLKGFPSFTPEMYGLIPGFFSGRNFFSFREGVPYKHHQGSAAGAAPLYANYYGTQCPVYVIPVVNPGVEDVKRFLWIEMYIKQTLASAPGTLTTALLYCSEIISEKGQQSRLLPAQFDIRDDFQAAAYLCDINTPFDPNIPEETGIHRITDGNPLMGRWLKVTIKTADEWPGTYFEFSSSVNGLNGIKISGGGK